MKSTQSLVSVLIPCYNAERYIAETLKSVLQQTWQSIEVIVVDDGSTDNSAEVVRSFADYGVRLVQQENFGQTTALNTALSYARGDFVQYLDADDILDPEKIALQMSRLSDEPGCIASAEWGRFYDTPANTRFDSESVWQDMMPLDWLELSRRDGLGMMFPAIWLIPMAVIRAVGPWVEDLTLNNDAEYFTRVVLAAERVLFCSGARCHYRSGIVGSLSGQKSAHAWCSQFKVIDLCDSYTRAREDSERMRRAFSLSWQHLAHACYPYDRALAIEALNRAKALHPIRVWPDGGLAFKVLSALTGWRLARRLQVLLGRP